MSPAATPSYPVTLDLSGRDVLVVGGGPVAARRAAGLLDAGARVRLVAPAVCEDLADLVATGVLTWCEREYLVGDLLDPEPVWLVHTATGDRDTDDAVAADADAARVWCVRADDAAASTAWTPAVARGGAGTPAEGLTVAVTAGGDPRRAVAVRDAVLAGLVSATLPVRRVRRAPSRAGPGRAGSGRAGSGVAGSERAGGPGDGGAVDRPGPPALGRVSLVGGGPGDPGLLTVRARQLLAAADVVVTDRLGPREVLAGLGADVEVVDVGKTPGNHPVPQDRINAILVEHARRGSHVVRLKGGDPFVLGRGGEEALHCAERGVPVEVVPGVTSAVSVPAAAGIPVTHRGVTASFVVASGHDGPEEVLDAARDAPADATLVLLMGVTRIGATAAGLVAAGRRPGTPVAVVESGWTPRQRTTWSTLGTVEADVAATGVRPPAVVVVGDVVAVGRVIAEAAGSAGGEGPA